MPSHFGPPSFEGSGNLGEVIGWPTIRPVARSTTNSAGCLSCATRTRWPSPIGWTPEASIRRFTFPSWISGIGSVADSRRKSSADARAGDEAEHREDGGHSELAREGPIHCGVYPARMELFLEEGFGSRGRRRRPSFQIEGKISVLRVNIDLKLGRARSHVLLQGPILGEALVDFGDEDAMVAGGPISFLVVLSTKVPSDWSLPVAIRPYPSGSNRTLPTVRAFPL